MSFHDFGLAGKWVHIYIYIKKWKTRGQASQYCKERKMEGERSGQILEFRHLFLQRVVWDVAYPDTSLVVGSVNVRCLNLHHLQWTSLALQLFTRLQLFTILYKLRSGPNCRHSAHARTWANSNSLWSLEASSFNNFESEVRENVWNSAYVNHVNKSISSSSLQEESYANKSKDE